MANHITARWMAADEQLRFFRDLQKPKFSGLRSIIQSPRPRSAEDGDRQHYNDEPMRALAFSNSEASFSMDGFQRSQLGFWGIYWRALTPGGPFGVFEMKARGYRFGIGSSKKLNYIEVWPHQNFFSKLAFVGVSASYKGSGELFLIYSTRKKDTPWVDGYGVGFGVGESPIEFSFEFGKTETIWNENDIQSFPLNAAVALNQLALDYRDFKEERNRRTVDKVNNIVLAERDHRQRVISKELKHGANKMRQIDPRGRP